MLRSQLYLTKLGRNFGLKVLQAKKDCFEIIKLSSLKVTWRERLIP